MFVTLSQVYPARTHVRVRRDMIQLLSTFWCLQSEPPNSAIYVQNVQPVYCHSGNKESDVTLEQDNAIPHYVWAS